MGRSQSPDPGYTPRTVIARHLAAAAVVFAAMVLPPVSGEAAPSALFAASIVLAAAAASRAVRKWGAWIVIPAAVAVLSVPTYAACAASSACGAGHARWVDIVVTYSIVIALGLVPYEIARRIMHLSLLKERTSSWLAVVSRSLRSLFGARQKG